MSIESSKLRDEAIVRQHAAQSARDRELTDLRERFTSRRPAFPTTAIKESLRVLGEEPCSIYPFIIGCPEESENRAIYLEYCKSLFEGLLKAFSLKQAGSTWIFPVSEIENLNMIQELVGDTIRRRPKSLPQYADINAAYRELNELKNGYLIPPGCDAISYMTRAGKRDKVVTVLLEKIQSTAWAGYKPYSSAWDEVKLSEVALEVAEFENPLRSLHDRLKKSSYLDVTRDDKRKDLKSYLDSFLSTVGESVPLKAERIREMADLFGEVGESYLRWLLELELSLFFLVARQSIGKEVNDNEVKGLDRTAAADLSRDALKIFERLKAGEFPAESVAFCKLMTEVMDPYLHGPLKGQDMEIPRAWRRFMYQCYVATDVSECRESLE